MTDIVDIGIKIDDRGGINKLDRADRGLTQLDRSTTKSAASLGRMAMQFAAVGTASIAVRKAVTIMADFQTRMAEVATISGGASGSVLQLRSEIIDLSRSVPQSASELGAGAYQVLSAGITDASEALGVLETSSRAAVGGLTQTVVAVDAITTVLNAYGLAASDASHISDLMFTTVERGKIKFDELASGIGIVAKQAAVMGVSFDVVSAALAAQTKATGRPRAAFTEIAGLFRTIIAEETASVQAAKALGLEWNLAALKAKGLSVMLADLNRATQGNAALMRQVIREDEAFRAAVVLSANGASALQTEIDGMNASLGAADRAYGTMADTIENRGQVAINNFTAALLEMTGNVLPVVTAELEGVVGIFDTFRFNELMFDPAVAAVNSLAGSLDGLNEAARELAITDLRKQMDVLAGGGGVLGRPREFAETIRTMSTAGVQALQEGFNALASESERFAFFTQQFSQVNAELRRRGAAAPPVVRTREGVARVGSVDMPAPTAPAVSMAQMVKNLARTVPQQEPTIDLGLLVAELARTPLPSRGIQGTGPVTFGARLGEVREQGGITGEFSRRESIRSELEPLKNIGKVQHEAMLGFNDATIEASVNMEQLAIAGLHASVGLVQLLKGGQGLGGRVGGLASLVGGVVAAANPLAGALMMASGGLLSGLTAPSNKSRPVTIEKYGPSALNQMRDNDESVNVTVIYETGGQEIKRVQRTLKRAELRDGVVRGVAGW